MKKQTASIAKIIPPQTGLAYPRKRLFKLLDKEMHVPILFLSSPAGSGKTTLVSSYLKARSLPCLWYRVDEGDSDVASFFYYMSLAITNLSNKKGAPLPRFLPDYARSISIFTRRYFEDLFSRLSIPFILVIDDYHNVPLSSLFHEMMSYGLTAVPDGIKIIILSRKEPPPSLVYFRANDRLHTIGWEEIRFNIEEAKGLIRLKEKGVNLNDKILSKLYRKTDGWAAGLVLICESAKELKFDDKALDSLPPIGIFNYFANEIFNKVEPAMHNFLLKTAFFTRFTPRMGDQITGTNTSEKILAHLYENNYFTVKYTEKESLYQYHPLFRQFLLSKTSDNFGQRELQMLMRDAAGVMEEAGHVEDSILLRIKAGDFDGLRHLITQHAKTLFEQGRIKTLLEWLDILPHDFLALDPWLLYWKGMCQLPYDQQKSLQDFEEAFNRFQNKQDSSGVFLSWSGIVESIIYGFESLKALDPWFSVLEKLIDEYKDFPSEYVEITATCSMLRSLALRRPPNLNAEQWIDRLRVSIKRRADINLRFRSLVNLATYHYSEGNIQALKTVIDSMGDMTKHVSVSPIALLNFFWLKTAYYNALSQYDLCRESIESGLAIVNETKIHVQESLLIGHAVLVSLKTGDHITARHYLEKLAASLNFMRSWEASFYHYAAGWEALYRDDHAQALFHSDLCLKLCEDVGNPWPLMHAHVLKSCVSDAFGDSNMTLSYINQAQTIAEKSKNPFSMFISHITKASFLLKNGQEKNALIEIRRAMKLGQEKGYVNCYMWMPGVLDAIVTKALEEGINVQYARDLISRNALFPDISRGSLENWPWPLKIHAMGGFNIIKNGKRLKFSGKVQHKPLSLLKAIIAFGGQEISELLLTDTIWPDADGQAAHSSFTTTLSRLRQLIGNEQAIRCSDGKVTLDPRHCWLDVWTFENMLTKVESLWGKRLSAEEQARCVDMAEKAVDMYKGYFLRGDDEPWMILVRERLQNKHLKNITRLGEYYEHAGKLTKAIEWYTKGIEADNLAETFYQSLMRCLIRLGRKAEAAAIYKQCCNTLSAILQMDPSPETQLLYKKLKN